MHEQDYRMIKRLKDAGVSILLATHEFHTVAGANQHSCRRGVLAAIIYHTPNRGEDAAPTVHRRSCYMSGTISV